MRKRSKAERACAAEEVAHVSVMDALAKLPDDAARRRALAAAAVLLGLVDPLDVLSMMEGGAYR